jgi:hypothetical protein
MRGAGWGATFVVLLGSGLAGQANANCVCRCVNGSVEPICSSSIDLPPICAPTICPIVPPSIAPIQPPTVPPIGTSYCSQQQVLNPYTNQYEWRRVCE